MELLCKDRVSWSLLFSTISVSTAIDVIQTTIIGQHVSRYSHSFNNLTLLMISLF